MGSGELQEVEGPGTDDGLDAAHLVPVVSVSKPENCTLSGASAKFRRFLEAQRFRSDGEGDAAFVVPTQTGAYAHSNR